MRAFAPLFIVALLGLFNGCESISDLTQSGSDVVHSIAASTNIDPDADEHLFQKDPDLWWLIHENAIAQDDRLRWGGEVKRLHDKDSGAPIGWEFGLSVKCAWPLDHSAISNPKSEILRSPFPHKTYPPDSSVDSGELPWIPDLSIRPSS